MQGWFGRFGKNSAPPPAANDSSHQQRQKSQSDKDRSTWENSTPEERDFPFTSFDADDEETNWDDAETEGNETNPIVPRFERQVAYSQPIAPVVPPPTKVTTSDLDDWDEALPAATVKSSNIQESRRGKNPQPEFLKEDLWDDDTDTPKASTGIPSGNLEPTASNRTRKLNQPGLRGFWNRVLAQFRQFLPAPIRQFSDAILIAIVVAIVTVGIWFVDGFFVPSKAPAVATTPANASQPAIAPTAPASPQIDPDRAFIEAIQTQLSEITSQYPDEIVKSIDIDLVRDRLIVQLAPLWYALDAQQQNSLTDRMWLQAQANHFTKLEIEDSQGIAIARSPVVGKHPIILQRKQS